MELSINLKRKRNLKSAIFTKFIDLKQKIVSEILILISKLIKIQLIIIIIYLLPKLNPKLCLFIINRSFMNQRYPNLISAKLENLSKSSKQEVAQLDHI